MPAEGREAFEFDRTVSRLIEMQLAGISGPAAWAAPIRPRPAIPPASSKPEAAQVVSRRAGARSARGRGTCRETADARILSIAADHLRRHGARGLTVVGVAEAAGMTHANVYRYFPSKGALIDAVAARWLKALEATLAEIADAPDPGGRQARAPHPGRWPGSIATSSPRTAHLFEVYAEAAESAGRVVRKHRARLRQLDRAGPRRGHRDRTCSIRATGSGRSPSSSDAAYRFINPVAVRLDADMPARHVRGTARPP